MVRASESHRNMRDVTSDAQSINKVLPASSMNIDAASAPLMPDTDRPELVLATEAVCKRASSFVVEAVRACSTSLL